MPDYESDFENKWDKGAKEELAQLKDIDGEDLYEQGSDLESESDNIEINDESSDEFEDIDSCDDEGWSHIRMFWKTFICRSKTLLWLEIKQKMKSVILKKSSMKLSLK